MAQYAIKNIRPNPFRHIDRYPIRREKVAALRESLRTTGFWGNVVARVRDGIPEIAYGHHRLVALREEYAPDYTVDLLIRDLHDDAMLQIMARENMEEWGTSAAIEHETVRAVVEAYADGKIELPQPEPTTPRRQLRYAPSFTVGDVLPARGEHPYTAEGIAKFIGWMKPSGEPQAKVHNALAALQLVEQGVLQESDFDGLTTKQAEAVIEQARRAAAQREAAARLHRQQAEQAARQAAEAERRRETAERERQRQEEVAARTRDEAARGRAEEEARRQADTRRRAEEERRLAERRQVAEERRAVEERDRGRREATTVGRTVSRELKAGRGYREAPAIAATVAEKRLGPPPEMNDFARRLATDLNTILDVDRDPRTKRLQVMIEYREDLQDHIRTDLARTLTQLADRATNYARRLESGDDTAHQRQLAADTRR